MTTIPAAIGEPYVIDLTAKGLVLLQRIVNGKLYHMVFSPADAIAVADALVDTAESAVL